MVDADTDSHRAGGDGLPAMQLRMVILASRASGLPDAVVPEGYELRPCGEGDEEGLGEVLRLSGFTQFDPPKVREYLEDPERRQGTRVVARGELVVSTTFASRRNLGHPVGMLDFVATHPEHRRRGLSRAVCTGVLRFFVDAGYREVILDTDDWRLPAIQMYLFMGFEPVMRREDMPARWESVMAKLDCEVEDHA